MESQKKHNKIVYKDGQKESPDPAKLPPTKTADRIESWIEDF